jgi:hypothetical protein
MGIPSLPILIGSGALITTGSGIVGFVLAVRTQLTAVQVGLLISGIVSFALVGLLLSESVQVAVTLLAYVIMIGFPLYALFWILNDFTERVVRS